ncbi:dihydroxyacetone kinase subunit DhaL [Microbacterium sp. LWS13-1.2]|uniref:Dihydroxyacetone kinase subunit L n=1 Tax=Microbacterium sp. LWS13-1.2 TaxID=3135264 RepID=A0AAU6SAS4_9MICO
MNRDGIEDVEFIVLITARTAVEREAEFGDLDAVVGDGDLGYSLARGFEVVLARWDSFDRADIGTFLQGIALAIASRVGGTSGPIWGTGFLRAAMIARGLQSVTPSQVGDMLDAAVSGIKERGKAEIGDKTLLDVLKPMSDCLREAIEREVESAELLPLLARTARSAAEATSGLQARRGRASYSGERSIGSPDAGAMVVAIILEQISYLWPERALQVEAKGVQGP